MKHPLQESLYFLTHHFQVNHVFLCSSGIPLNILWYHSSHPKFSSCIFYLLWFSDASIMALNLEFSSASKAAGLSNSKIYENEKDKTNHHQHIKSQVQLTYFKKLCRKKINQSLLPSCEYWKLFPTGSIWKNFSVWKNIVLRQSCYTLVNDTIFCNHC